MSEPVTVNPSDMWTLLLSTVRYSLGRRSYMTWVAPELVKRYAASLAPHQLRQVAKEIRDEVEMYDRGPGDVIPDRDAWLRDAAEIERMAEEREHV